MHSFAITLNFPVLSAGRQTTFITIEFSSQTRGLEQVLRKYPNKQLLMKQLLLDFLNSYQSQTLYFILLLFHFRVSFHQYLSSHYCILC